MFIKTKKVQLKNGKLQNYHYVARSVRTGKKVKPQIIKYIGKTVPPEIRNWIKKKNRERRKK